MSKKKLTLQDKITADIDDEIALLYERIKLKYGLTWAKARDGVNGAIKELFSV